MNDVLWVKIETTKGGREVWVIRGRIAQSVFEDIVANRVQQGYFRVDEVYWITPDYDDQGNDCGDKIVQYGEGDLDAHKGDLYLKVEHLISLAPIDGEMEIAKLQKKDQPHLSLVSPLHPK